MAYTADIDETTPLGSDDASGADDQIRNLKRDIKERLQSIFADWNLDPLRLLLQYGHSIWVKDNADVEYPALSINVEHLLWIGGGPDGTLRPAIQISQLSSLPAHTPDRRGLICIVNNGGVVVYTETQRIYIAGTPF